MAEATEILTQVTRLDWAGMGCEMKYKGVSCSLDECEEPARTNGFCSKHYMRVFRNGTVELVRPKPLEIKDGKAYCRWCDEWKELKSFRLIGDRRITHCNQCRYRLHDKPKADAMRDQLQAYKLDQGCIDCGYKEHAVALDFDHRPGEVKLFALGSAMVRNPVEVWAEVAKCDVRCANCHRIITEDRRLAKVGGM
jgi:hypothetical protein